MAIPFTNYAGMTPQGNPFMRGLPENIAQGLKLGNMPQKMKQEQLAAQRQEQMNALQQSLLEQQVKSAPGQQTLDNRLKEAQIKQYLAKATAAGMPVEHKASSPTGKAQADLEYAMAHGASPKRIAELQAGVNKSTAQSRGISVTTDANGNPVVQIGGSGGGSRGGAKNYTDASGNITTTPTNAESSRIQKALATEESFQDFTKDLTKNLAPFLDPKKKAQLGVTQFLSGYIPGGQYLEESGPGKWLGLDPKLPSQYATGKSAITEAAENLLSKFQLNASTESINKLAQIMTPITGERPEYYTKRIQEKTRQYLRHLDHLKRIQSHGFNTGKMSSGKAKALVQNNGALSNALTQGSAQQQGSGGMSNSDPLGIL